MQANAVCKINSFYNETRHEIECKLSLPCCVNVLKLYVYHGIEGRVNITIVHSIGNWKDSG